MGYGLPIAATSAPASGFWLHAVGVGPARPPLAAVQCVPIWTPLGPLPLGRRNPLRPVPCTTFRKHASDGCTSSRRRTSRAHAFMAPAAAMKQEIDNRS
jgi:hypothetical protein